MKRITVVVADDEDIARTFLAEILQRQEDIDVRSICSDGYSALAHLSEEPADILFADISMPGMTGIDLVARLAQLEKPPFAVFTTAHAQYALTAFELGAVDYLLKPFGEQRVQRTLERYRRSRVALLPKAGLEKLSATLSQSNPHLSRFFVRGHFGIRQVYVEDVDHFSAEGDYVRAHIGEAAHLISIRLRLLEQVLPPDRFIRTHRSHIVNLVKLTEFRFADNGSMTAVLANGSAVPVSRRYAGVVRSIAI